MVEARSAVRKTATPGWKSVTALVRDWHSSRIFSACDVANAASARVLEKSGLQRIATLDRHQYALGTW
jgi:RimJ/RimL family protein N-acetyltransferase